MASAKSRYFSIKWKAFTPTSLLLSLVFLGFIVTNAFHFQHQFETNRDELFHHHMQQLDSLLQQVVYRNQQLVASIGVSPDVQAALLENDRNQIQASLTEPYWTLNMEAGVSALAIYGHDGQEMAVLGEHFRMPALVADALDDERPRWAISCYESSCELSMVMPLLAEGEVKFVAMSASLGDVIVQFSQMTGIEVAVLMGTERQSQEPAHLLPGWYRAVAALTHREQYLPLLMSIAESHSLEELRSDPLVMRSDRTAHEVRAFEWKGLDLVLIDDISNEYGEIKDALRNSIFYGLIGLILAELLLLWILWKPMARLSKIAGHLPMLAKNEFDELRVELDRLERNRVFDDEIDLLYDTAATLSTQLETMQTQLRARNQELEQRGADLQSERDFVRQLLNTIPAMILMLDRNGIIIMINQHGANMTGYSPFELEGHSIQHLIPADIWDTELKGRLADLLDQKCTNVSYESAVVRRGDSLLHMAWHNTLIHDRESRQQAILSVAIDITARKNAEERMSWLATHDTLTGLYNRRRFTDELNQVLERNKRTKLLSALMFFDLDQFKDVNDTSGHQTGDLLLKRIAQSLLETARHSDFVARLDGDEFALIANDVSPEDLPVVAERFARALSQVNVEGRGHRHRCTASIGIAMIPWHGETVEDLLSNADLAMYRAKEAGRNQWQIFDPREDTTERVRERVYWNEKVDQVLKTGDFEIYFQPIQDLNNGAISHYEALLRVFSDDGVLATGLFIQAAERNGAIHLLDERIIERVMAHQAELIRHGIDACVAINLSGASFQHPERLFQHVEQLLEKYRVPAGSLIFEITETAAVKDINITRQHITMMRNLGFKFALDDFGVGFSSLFYLKQLPVDYLKIDGSFIRNLCSEPDDQALVQALVQVARIYRLKSVAEFVENQDIVELLKSYDVDFAQGYHIGRPQPFEQVFFKDRPRLGLSG